jgi:hypothetical protein
VLLTVSLTLLEPAFLHGLWRSATVRKTSQLQCNLCEAMRPSGLLAALFRQDARLAWLDRIALVMRQS